MFESLYGPTRPPPVTRAAGRVYRFRYVYPTICHKHKQPTVMILKRIGRPPARERKQKLRPHLHL